MRGLGDSPRAALRALALLVVMFAAVTGIALLAGATNLGTAMTFGQIAFVAAVALILIWG